MNDWASFGIVVTVQALLLLVFVWREGTQATLRKKGVVALAIGLPFGITFDLVFGKSAGIFSYELDFEYWFLILNGLLSYGLMIATVLTFANTTLGGIDVRAIMIGVVYECVNFFFPVWQWTITDSQIEQAAFMCFFGYPLLAILMALVLQLLGIKKFTFITNSLSHR